MAFVRPTLQTIIDRVQSDIEGRITGADATLKNTLLNILAMALAGVAHGLYGYQAWQARQILPDTAENELLDRHADWWGVTRNPVAAAVGTVTFTGTDAVTIPAGTTLQRSDGAEYTTDADGVIASGSVSVAVTASLGGVEGNASSGQSLQLVTPISGVQSVALVDAGGLVGGTDIETDDALRTRLRQRVQQAPQGGAGADYDVWAKEVSGVTRVWVLPQWLGAGTVGVAFVRDGDATFIPDAAEVQAVQDYIDTVRPVTASVSVFAPTAVPVGMTIKLSPNTAAVQAAVQAELDDLFARDANVEDGAGSGTMLLSRINEAISIATGELDHVLVTPVADVTLSAGEIATVGTITWQAL